MLVTTLAFGGATGMLPALQRAELALIESSYLLHQVDCACQISVSQQLHRLAC